MSAPSCGLPPLSVLIALPAWILVLGYATCHLSGWRLLSERFRATEPFYGESWGFQSARFRKWLNFNNCLTVGASQEYLYLSITPIFRFFTPCAVPLLIPWREIEVEKGKMFWGWYDTATFRIGSGERVNVRLYGKLVRRVREAAGPGWPLCEEQQSSTQRAW